MNKYKIFIVITFAVFFNILKTQAQDIRLQQIFDNTLESYPGFDGKRAKIKAAEYQKNQVNAQQLPQVNVQLQNTYGTFQGSTGSVFPLPGVYNISGSNGFSEENLNTTINTYGSAIADWTVFSFGKVQKQRQAASMKVQAAENDFSAYELSLKSKVTELYLLNLYYDANYRWSQLNSERVKEILELSKSLVIAGLQPGADTSLAVSAYLQILAKEDNWKGSKQAGKHQLSEFSELDISEKEIHSNAYLSYNPALKSDSSFQKHPYLEVIQTEVQVYKALEEAAARSIFPSLSILGGISVRGSGAENGNVSNNWNDGFNHSKSNFLVGLGLKWNLTGIYDQKMQQRKLHQEKINISSKFKQQEREINSGVEAVNVQIKEQIQSTVKATQSVEKAQEAFELYKERYESGLMNLFELLQIQSLLQDAEYQQINAFHKLWEMKRIQAEYTADFSELFEIF